MVQFVGYKSIADFQGARSGQKNQFGGGIIRLFKDAENYWNFNWTTEGTVGKNSYQFFYIPNNYRYNSPNTFEDIRGWTVQNRPVAIQNRATVQNANMDNEKITNQQNDHSQTVPMLRIVQLQNKLITQLTTDADTMLPYIIEVGHGLPNTPPNWLYFIPLTLHARQTQGY